MEEDLSIKVKKTSTYIIPKEDIYKIHVLNDEGNVQYVFVFCAGLRSSKDETVIFSEIEIAYYKRHDVEIIYSNKLIHADDTIRDIKHKIVSEILDFHKKVNTNDYLLSVEEVYMFGLSKKDLDMIKVYQEITENDTKKLTKEKFFQYATNISSDPYVLDKKDGEKGGLYSDIFSYEQWIGLTDSGVKELYVPIGMEFQNSYDFLFPTNPFKNQLWTETIRYKSEPKNPLLTLDKSILLDYTKDTDIIVCLAKSAFKYAETHDINTEYLSGLYFPFLFKSGLTTSSLLLESSMKLSDETKQYNTSKIIRKHNITQIYREIYWNADEKLPYTEKGIKHFSITIKSFNSITNFPLDLLFRNLHATEIIPFIKYNPGSRRENMYRLFSDNISNDGKKIPSMDETNIMRLSREIGKSKQVSLYVKDKIGFIVNINANSEIEVLGHLQKLLTVSQLNEEIATLINPVLTQLNVILQPSGYKVSRYTDIEDDNIINIRLTYQSVLPIDNKMNLQKQLDYINPIFDVLSTDVSKGANMRFKRITNYKEMNAQNAYIREIYDRTGNTDEVIQGLIDNFDLEQDAAVLLFAEFRSQFQLLKQKIAENPGFKTLFQMKPLKSELLVEVIDVNSVHYIREIELYIDAILRMSQKPKTTNISASKLKLFKSKDKSTSDVEDKIETVIVPQEQTIELYKPLVFAPENKEEDDEEEIEDVQEGVGIEFDDADYYQDYADDAVDEEGGLDSDEEDFFGGENKEQPGGGINFDDADYYIGGSDGENDEDFHGGENTPEEEKYKANIDGMSIKNPTPFFKRMRELDPTLYVTEESSKFPLYSKACPSGDRRQPIVLTDAEKKKIDETNPGSYGRALHHGSSEDNKNWYICPRYWCLKTNSSISEEDVKAGKCGGIIPRGADKVPQGAYVYEFNSTKQHMKDGKYVQHVPGLLKKDKHPDGTCIPCCFGKAWDSNDQVKRRQSCGLEEETKQGEVKSKKSKKNENQHVTNKTFSYVISSVSYPLPQSRWGFLPLALQIFFKMDSNLAVDPKNSSLIRGGEKCILRYGVEKSENQSFIACLAHFYAYKQGLSETPTIEEMRKIFASSIDIDMFVRYHNGNLVSSFRSKRLTKEPDIGPHEDSDFYKTISLDDETQVEYLHHTVTAYNNFIAFIENKESIIDHTYIWDFFCGRNKKLLKDGMNLIILQMTDQDITERVQLICPSNAYSKVEYDETKETVILLKQDKFYEPIHLYEQYESIVDMKTNDTIYTLKKGEELFNNKIITKDGTTAYKVKSGQIKKNEVIFKKAFIEASALNEIRSVLKLIKDTKNTYCRPLPSLPKKYKFEHNIPITELVRVLKNFHYKISAQVMNYRNKAIGVMVNKEEDQSLLFVPCFPSAMVKNIPSKFMDDDDLWLDYRTTRDRLQGLSKDTGGKILSKPKVKIIEDGLVIGFLTETNQFVQINPPTQPIDKDLISEVKHYSNKYNDGDKHKSAEKILTTTTTSISGERISVIRNINLETQFYNIFRTIIRMHLNQFEFRQIRKEILATIDDPHYSYRGKLKDIEKELRLLLQNKIDFKEIDEKDLQQIERVVLCSDDGNCLNETSDKPSYCLMSDDGNCVSIFPKKHLLSGSDNEKIYFGRMADELVRYKRSRLFLFYPKNYMNITNTDFFINTNELFLLETRLTRDYFRNIIPFGNNGINEMITFDAAQPDMEYSGSIQNYSNKVSLKEQDDFIDEKGSIKGLPDFILDCIEHTKPNVIGNLKEGSWRKIFPNTAKELFFHKTVNCSFIPIIYIIQSVYLSVISVQNIKTALWKGYSDIFKNESAEKYVYSILRKQGKSMFMDKIKRKKTTFETIVFSDEYYITDLDWWVFSTAAQLPVILFSSTSLKTLSPSLQWIRMGGKSVDQKHFFVRSPSEVKTNVPSKYHIIEDGYTFNQLQSDVFTNAARGDLRYTKNMQTINEFLSKSVIVKR